ncbi:Uncharacterised protein [uncultured Prevotella sp.]|nr:Uncharacterised protein [uncultured Prevotella sp.]
MAEKHFNVRLVVIVFQAKANLRTALKNSAFSRPEKIRRVALKFFTREKKISHT